MEDDEIDLTDAEIFDISTVRCDAWRSKDRTVTTFRLSDKSGLNEMKVYLVLKDRLAEMEVMLGLSDGEPHLRQ